MPLDEKDKNTHITTLQTLQRDINFYKKVNENNQNPSLDKIIDILRNSQDQLYSALAQHGVTADEVHQIIQENSDKQLINEIMKLQGMKDRITKQLANLDLSVQKCDPCPNGSHMGKMGACHSKTAKQRYQRHENVTLASSDLPQREITRGNIARPKKSKLENRLTTTEL